MQKSQIATSRKQKASSAVTPKASHLRIVSERDTNMNNSTALDLNNQVTPELARIVRQAKNIAEMVNKSAHALKSIGKIIDMDVTNKDAGNDSLNGYILGGLSQAIDLITGQLEEGAEDLGDSLIKGGYANE